MKKGFFEFIGMSSLEKVHSEVIGWLLSDSCHSTANIRKNLLNQLITKASIEIPASISVIQTVAVEYESFDIYIESKLENQESWFFIIENKLKSSEHSNQFSKYPDRFEVLYPGKKNVCFIYLTLIEEKSLNKHQWRQLLYSDIYSVLLKNKSRLVSGIDDQIVLAYINTLASLTNIMFEFDNIYTGLRKFVFTSPKKSKKELLQLEKKVSSESNETQLYIDNNQLQTLLQRHYYHHLISRIQSKIDSKIKIQTGETRGTAYIEFIFPEIFKLPEWPDKEFHSILQLQGRQIKFAIAPGLSSSEKIEGQKIRQFYIKLIQTRLVDLQPILPDLEEKKIQSLVTSPRVEGKGFCSFKYSDWITNNTLSGWQYQTDDEKLVLGIYKTAREFFDILLLTAQNK